MVHTAGHGQTPFLPWKISHFGRKQRLLLISKPVRQGARRGAALPRGSHGLRTHDGLFDKYDCEMAKWPSIWRGTLKGSLSIPKPHSYTRLIVPSQRAQTQVPAGHPL